MATKEYRLSIIVSGKDAGASSMLSGIGGSLRSIGTIAGGIMTSQIFMAIARQIGNMASSALNAVGQFQNMQMMLTSLQARELIKSGDFTDMNAALAASEPLVKSTMDQLQRIATLSPYQLENVSNTYKMAMAFGYTSKEATMFTNAILNVAAGTGATGEMLDRMAYNLAQVRMQGKVTGVDIRQLAMAGFDLVDVLKFTGKQMGVNIKTHEDFNKAIESGEITWEDFTKSFAEYADTNFGGASERMSRTLEGLKSTFKDVFIVTMPKIFGPVTEMVTEKLNTMLNGFLAFVDSGVLEEFGGQFAKYFDGDYARSGLLGMTKDFKDWAKSVDWEGISQDIAAGIDSIDWITLGERTAEGAKNIGEGIATAFKETDWNALFSSAGNGFMDFMAGMTGQDSFENVKATWQTNFDQMGSIMEASLGAKYEVAGMAFLNFLAKLTGQENFETVKATWAMNWEQLGLIVTTSLDQTHIAGTTKAAAIGLAIPAAMTSPLVSGGLTIASVVAGWLPMIGAQLEAIKKLFFNMMQAAAQQAIRALLGMQSSVIGAVQTFITAIQNVVKPINIAINVATPNWDKLIAEAEAGMAALRAAMHGGTGSVGGRSTNQGGGGATGGGGGGNGSAHGGNQTGFADGGISRGPTSGYQALLHGEEAVIPLKNGAVPVDLGNSQKQPIQIYINIEKVASDMDVHEMAYKIASVIAERG